MTNGTRLQPSPRLGQRGRDATAPRHGLPNGLPAGSPTEVSPAKARSILAKHVADGKQIVLSATMVGDQDDFAVWSRRCENWTIVVRDSLARIYGEEAATTFHRATAAAPTDNRWQTVLADELERMQTVVAMLISLTEGAR